MGTPAFVASAAVSTTYGVGELSAINAIAGAYAEHAPGVPPGRHADHGHAGRARMLVHHTLGNGEFDLFRKMAEPVVCASAIMTPQNVAYETERLIAEALYHRRPVYMAFPSDVANQTVVSKARPIGAADERSGQSCRSAAEAILAALQEARTACILPGLLAVRVGRRTSCSRLVDASGLPFATMFMDKSALEEQQAGLLRACTTAG